MRALIEFLRQNFLGALVCALICVGLGYWILWLMTP